MKSAYNYRMSDLHAAVGIEQMKKLDFMLTRRQSSPRVTMKR